MKTFNFIKLINAITGREFNIDTKHEELELDYEYFIYKVLPINKRHIGFNFRTPKKEENLVKSFITQFSMKYLEPDPKNYDGSYPGSKTWEQRSAEEREFAYYHHKDNMYSKKALIEQIKANMNIAGIEDTFTAYAFYPTLYGIGLFVLFADEHKLKIIQKMKAYLSNRNIPFTNKFSNARWVYRFIINIDKDIHNSILNDFHKSLK